VQAEVLGEAECQLRNNQHVRQVEEQLQSRCAALFAGP
jgi:hypothetical protein